MDYSTHISFLQIFGILLVVIGHSCYGALIVPWWHTWIYSFHMPLFMFISGYLLKYSSEKKASSLFIMSWEKRGVFLWKKVKRLIIPYLVISTLAFVPKVLMSRFAARPLDFSFSEYARMLIYPWDNAIIFFWFLPTLFLIFVLVIVFTSTQIGRGKKNFLIWILFGMLLIHLFNPIKGIKLMNIGGVVSYLFYFVLGYSCCRWSIFTHLGKYVYIGALSSLIISILLVFALPVFWGKDVLTALVGILLSLYLSKIYVSRDWHFFHHLFGASYAIYLFSWFPQTASQQVLQGLTHAPWQLTSVLAMITGVYIPWLIYKWIVRHKQERVGRFVALLTGQ